MARSLNGTTSDKIEITSTTPINITGTALSISVWLRKTDTGTRRYVAAKGGAAGASFTYGIRVDASNQFVFLVDDGSGTYDNAASSTTLSASTWYHILGVKNGTGANAIRIYVNGSAEGLSTSNVSLVSNANSLVLGYLSTGATTEIWSGDLAEFGIWNVALTADEAVSLAKGAAPSMIRPQSIQAYYPLIGRASPEQDLRFGSGGTVTGTAASAHPRMIWPAPPLDGRRSALTRSLTFARTSTSTTPDTAALPVARALTVARSSTSSTPDTIALLRAIAQVLALFSGSSTPDTVTLVRALTLALNLASTSSTTDTAALISLVPMVIALASTSSTPDTAALPIARALLFAIQSLSSTPDLLLPWERYVFSVLADEWSSAAKRTYSFTVPAERRSSTTNRTTFSVPAESRTSEA